MCTCTFQSQAIPTCNKKYKEKILLKISRKTREGEVGIKGKRYKSKRMTVKKLLKNLLLTLHLCYPLSEAEFVAHSTSAHRNEDVMAYCLQ